MIDWPGISLFVIAINERESKREIRRKRERKREMRRRRERERER